MLVFLIVDDIVLIVVCIKLMSCEKFLVVEGCFFCFVNINFVRVMGFVLMGLVLFILIFFVMKFN